MKHRILTAALAVCAFAMPSTASASELTLVANTTFTQQSWSICSTETVQVTGTEGESVVNVTVPEACKGEAVMVYLAQDGTTYSAAVDTARGTASFSDADFKLATDATALVTADTWPLKTETKIDEDGDVPFVTCTVENGSKCWVEITQKPGSFLDSTNTQLRWNNLNLILYTDSVTSTTWSLTVNTDSQTLTDYLVDNARRYSNPPYWDISYRRPNYLGINNGFTASNVVLPDCDSSQRLVTFQGDAAQWNDTISSSKTVTVSLEGSSETTQPSDNFFSFQIFSCPAS